MPVDAVTLQNEPQNRFPFEYPGMDFRDPEEARLIKSVGPAFQNAGIDTKILGYDHNWSLHPDDVGRRRGRTREYRIPSVLDDPEAKRWLAGTAFHCYSGDPSAQSDLHAAHPDRESTSPSAPACTSGDPATLVPGHAALALALPDDRRHPQLGQERDHVEPRARPEKRAAQRRLRHLHGRRDDRPGDRQGDPRGRLLRLGHVTKFVKKGAVRIELDRRGEHLERRVPQPGRLDRRARQQRRLGHRSQRFNLNMGSESLSYDLPAGAVATFVLK